MRSEEHLKRLAAEGDALAGAFEGCPSDLEDLQIMRQALRLYQKDYRQLDDNRLTWAEFDALVEALKAEALGALGNEELPWPPDEAINGFVSFVSKHRKEVSANWIEALETDVRSVSTMSAADANQLHIRANSPPAVLTDAHAQRLNAVLKTIETRLDALKIDWLVEKFKELPVPLRKKFLQMVTEGADD